MTQQSSELRSSVFQRYLDAQEVPEVVERILDASIRLFARKGYAATSVREIVQEADVTNPMLYYYFTNKEGVFIKLIDLFFGIMDMVIEQTLIEHQGIEDRLSRIIEAHMEGATEAPEALRFLYAAIFGPRESRPSFNLPERSLNQHIRIKSIFDDAIKSGEFQLASGFTTDFLAQQFMGTLNNYLMSTLTVLDLANQDQAYVQLCLGPQARDQLLALFFHGAGSIHKEQSR